MSTGKSLSHVGSMRLMPNMVLFLAVGILPCRLEIANQSAPARLADLQKARRSYTSDVSWYVALLHIYQMVQVRTDLQHMNVTCGVCSPEA